MIADYSRPSRRECREAELLRHHKVRIDVQSGCTLKPGWAESWRFCFIKTPLQSNPKASRFKLSTTLSLQLHIHNHKNGENYCTLISWYVRIYQTPFKPSNVSHQPEIPQHIPSASSPANMPSSQISKTPPTT